MLCPSLANSTSLLRCIVANSISTQSEYVNYMYIKKWKKYICAYYVLTYFFPLYFLYIFEAVKLNIKQNLIIWLWNRDWCLYHKSESCLAGFYYFFKTWYYLLNIEFSIPNKSVVLQPRLDLTYQSTLMRNNIDNFKL